MSEIVELVSISLAMCVIASSHSWADSSTCYSTTFTAHTLLHTRIFRIESPTDVDARVGAGVDVDLEVNGTCAFEIPFALDVAVVVVMLVIVVIIVRIIAVIPDLEVYEVRRV